MSALRRLMFEHDYSPLHLCLLVHDDEPGTERAPELWSGFLYGQPMSVPPSDWPENHNALDEFLALVKVHQLSVDYDHSDSEDASLDAIRDLFHQARDLDWDDAVPTAFEEGTVVMQLLADFVVYGEQGDAYAELIEAKITLSNKRHGRVPVSQEKEFATHKKLLGSSNELLKIFIQKGKDERAGVTAPDLMARCRYHSHAEKGQPCYLDK